MRIGRKIREVEDIPRPIRVPRREPERVPVPVRREVPKEPVKVGSGRLSYIVEEIPYGCPYCGRELVMKDSILYCPEHGVVYYG